LSDTLLTIFDAQVEQSGSRPALRYRSGGIWRSRTWEEWRTSARELAAALCEWGIAPGDRVAILSHTRIRWVEADLGILHAGAATVPIYPTLLSDMIGEILRDSGARILIAENPVQLAKVWEASAGPLVALERALVFDRVSRLERPDAQGRLDVAIEDVLPEDRAIEVLTFEDALALGRARLAARPDELAERAARLEPSSLAALYYTSGTSGEPKGVELTHDNFVFEIEELRELMPVSASDEQLLFLPLAHIVAKLTVMLQLRVGFVTAFAASMEQAAEDCAEVKPSFIVGVPRVYEKIQEAIQDIARRGGDIKERVFSWSMRVGARVSKLRREGREPSTALALQHRSAERLVFSRVKERLGGRIRFMLSGAAPLAPETAEFFHALDLLILEGYGLTESTGATTINLPHRYKFGSVGLPLPNVSVRVAPDGEIQLKGRSITPGYFGREEEARDAFTGDGWFRTGDVGTLDRDGFLTITDRKKDLIITAGGKNVAPQRVEQRLERSGYIARAVVLGDRRKFPVALIVLDGAAIQRWSETHALAGGFASLGRHPKVRALISAEIDKVNAGLASFESVKRFEILERDLSIERGELTPTGKVRRRAVHEHFADLIDTLYEGTTADLEDLT
jgi:long-chain acyl-CoA synthetase